MKKIDAVAWIDDGGMLFVNDSIIPDGTDLYTSDALLAVAEAVRDECINSGDFTCRIQDNIDLQAIINQLTGE